MYLLTSIINTVYSNIHTRIGEIGMQRAIGMSAASLYKTFLWEGAYYGIFASAIGAVLGYVCCIFVGAAQTDTLQAGGSPRCGHSGGCCRLGGRVSRCHSHPAARHFKNEHCGLY